MSKDTVESKLQEITQSIVAKFQPEKIILFGSYAWGEPGPDSDVDLLVIKRSERPRFEQEQELATLLFPRELPLDLFVYTPEELEKAINGNRNLFLEDVVRNGKVLYAKPRSTIHIVHERPLVVLE